MPQRVETVPDNVPSELVIDFDYYALKGTNGDIQAEWAELHKGPDIVWTPHYGGHWIATRAADIGVIQLDHEHFSHNVFDLPKNPHGIKAIPLALDPPEHTPYRKLLMTGFTPQKIGKLSDVARDTAKQLIAAIKPRGECEFIDEFAKVLPINVFLTMMDLPLSDRPWLLPRADIAVHSNDVELKTRTQGELAGYLMTHIEARRGNNSDDLLSMIMNGEIEGRPLTIEEIMAMALLALVGGLDTVASQIGFVANFLAKSPDHRRALVENPRLNSVACEEFLRRFSLPNTSRELTMDYEYAGIHFRKGDIIQIPKALYSLDERVNPDPMTVDFGRKPSVIKHMAFGAGPHVCPGNGLARRELMIFLEEWLQAIPDFEIDPARLPEFSCGGVNSVKHLYLRWEVR